ncbi:MAG: helix-hairpin-helix domain-containing protein [Clostridiales bacterium]|nr:helix-hairpin-helix domain-containing protein [Clostridiales bacterium]
MGIIYIVTRNSGAEVIRDGEIIFSAGGEMVSDAVENNIYVHITGAVNNPGVYELPKGARVNDALEMAGGATDDANLSHTGLNLAAVLQDEMRIIIPASGEEDAVVIPSEIGTASNTVSGGMVNINTASLAELQTLSGIGPARAQSIIDFRNANGNFSSVDELIHITGIGQATLDRLRPSITVR